MAGESEIGDLKLPYLTRTEGRSLTPAMETRCQRAAHN